MKKIAIIVVAILANTVCFSQTQADDILGYYLATDLDGKEKSQMEIYKTSDGKYEARVVWMENKVKNNQVGTVQIRNLSYNAKNQEWSGGKVKYKNTEYSITASISEAGKLKLRGFAGISLFGKTMYWIKEDKLRK